MIAYLGEWIKHLVLIILVATFLDLLLPNNQMRRYITLVVGLIIIVMILSPILALLQVDHERMVKGIDQLLAYEGEQKAFSADEKAQQIQAFQDQAVLKEVERMWAEEIKDHLEQHFPLRVEEVKVALSLRDNEPILQKISLSLSPKEGVEKDGGLISASVEPVNIVVQRERRLSEREMALLEGEWKDELVTYFGQEWNISEDKVEIFWTGG